MVTQCTKCRMWFRVVHEQLHAAHGLVRCSHCGTVFNALATLRDRVPEDEGPPAPQRAPQDEARPAPERPRAPEAEAVVDAAEEEPELPLLERPAHVPAGRRWPWALALAVAVLVLAGQLVHAGRRALATTPVLGPGVAAAYRLLGHPIAPLLTLARYRIATASLDGAGGQSGALVLRGVLHNAASYPQALPLISVTLTDRYGDVVASRVLAPAQYAAPDKSALGANLSLPFHVKLADPGSRAVGFSLTLCKRRAGSVLCQTS